METSPPPSTAPASPAATPPAKRRRWWSPRISLRTALVLMLVLGTGLGIGGNFWRKLMQKRRAVALVEGAGGSVHYSYEFGYYDEQDPLARISTHHYTNDKGIKERALKIGSRTIAVEQEIPPGPKFLRRLLGDNTFADVDGINFEWADRVGDIPPETLASFPKLKFVALRNQQVSDPWLRQCADIGQLTMLHVSSRTEQPLTSAGLRELDRADRLRHLSLIGDWLRDHHFSAVGELDQVRHIHITGSPGISSAVFADLAQLTQLQSLEVLRCPGIDDSGTEHLAELQNLQILWIYHTKAGDRTVTPISKLKKLQILQLSNTNVGDAGVAQLAGNLELRTLGMANTKVGDIGIAALSGLQQLEVLILNGTAITDKSIPVLATLSKLETLNLGFSSPDLHEESLLQLQTLPHLKRLTVGPYVTKEGMRKLRKALPQCEVSAFDAQGSGIFYAHEENWEDTPEDSPAPR